MNYNQISDRHFLYLLLFISCVFLHVNIIFKLSANLISQIKRISMLCIWSAFRIFLCPLCYCFCFIFAHFTLSFLNPDAVTKHLYFVIYFVSKSAACFRFIKQDCLLFVKIFKISVLQAIYNNLRSVYTIFI